MNAAHTATTNRAIKKYGEAACREAYRLHIERGFGASGIANECGLNGIRTTNQADAAINAGRALAKATGGAQ